MYSSEYRWASTCSFFSFCGMVMTVVLKEISFSPFYFTFLFLSIGRMIFELQYWKDFFPGSKESLNVLLRISFPKRMTLCHELPFTKTDQEAPKCAIVVACPFTRETLSPNNQSVVQCILFTSQVLQLLSKSMILIAFVNFSITTEKLSTGMTLLSVCQYLLMPQNYRYNAYHITIPGKTESFITLYTYAPYKKSLRKFLLGSLTSLQLSTGIWSIGDVHCDKM